MKVHELFEGSPSDFAKPKLKFKKLDDLPGKGLGRPHTPAEVDAAMQVLHKMLHNQADAYGGKKSKLLPAGIAEAKSDFKRMGPHPKAGWVPVRKRDGFVDWGKAVAKARSMTAINDSWAWKKFEGETIL